MEDKAYEESVRLPAFSGAHKDFEIWWMCFKAFASIYGFSKSIQQTPDTNMPVSKTTLLDPTADADKVQIQAKKSNQIALANLVTAFKTDALLGMIHHSKTMEWPSGLAYIVVDSFQKKYRRQDKMSQVEMRRELDSIKLKKYEDPATMFEALRGIESKYTSASINIDEEDLTATAIAQAEKEYKTVVLLQQQLKVIL